MTGGVFIAGRLTRLKKEKTAPAPDGTEASALQGITEAEGIQTTSEDGYSQEEMNVMM